MKPEEQLDDFDNSLRKQGVRVTQARKNVYTLLAHSTNALSAAQIDATLRDQGIEIDLVTVYRTLETLERCSLISRVDRLDEGWRYALRSNDHHHQIICSECGSSSPLDACDLNRIERSLEKQTGFTNICHSLQFYGTCPGCRR